VLFSSLSGDDGDWNSGTLEVVEVETGRRTVLHRGGSQGRYVATGHVVFYHQGTLFALPFNAETLQTQGSQFPVLEGVSGRPGHGGADFDVSDEGLLAYVSGGQGTNPFRIVSVDRDGRAQPLWEETGLYGTPRLSPDGKRLALTVLRDGNFDVWVFDLERTVATRLTFAEAYDGDQIWSPDGQWVAFASDRDNDIKVYRKRADGSGDVELVAECKDEGQQCFPSAWSADGRLIAVATGNSDIWMVHADGSGEPEPYLTSPALEGFPSFSPDGRWVTYESSESGSPAVYVQSYPLGGGKWQVSDGMGVRPLWSRDGREIVYRTEEGLSVVAVDSSGGTLRPEKARPLFAGPFLGDVSGLSIGGSTFTDYEMAPDGRRFVMFTGQEGSEVAWVSLVGGWFEELKRRGGAGAK
jgi:dipeptidyl aminopeptidase/acylaminoacyl peptidase